MDRLSAHFEGIESLLIEQIENAERSVYIVMAWLTSAAIKQALVWARQDDPDLHIEIVVDENDINAKYFYNTKKEFEDCGIVLRKKVDKRFLHRKFMVVDELITIVGSFNYSNKAKFNAENISVIEDKHLSEVHLRIFKALTDPDYQDENISLLFKYPLFAQKLLSTYYLISRQQFKKYQRKILPGNCFTAFNGYCDDLHYEAGFVFNPQCKFDKALIASETEFTLPVSKRYIKNWTRSRNDHSVIESYRESPEFWDQINDDLKNVKKGIKKQFRTIISSTQSNEELSRLIENDVDIIQEDRLWPDNFQPFIDADIVDQLFLLFPETLGRYDFFNSFIPGKNSKKIKDRL